MQSDGGVESKIFQPVILLGLLGVCNLHLKRRMSGKHRVKQLRRIWRRRRLWKCAVQADVGRGWQAEKPGQP